MLMDDHDPVETQEWVDSLRSVVAASGCGARALPVDATARRGAAQRARCRRSSRRRPITIRFAPEQEEKPPWQPRARAQDPLGDPLERGGDHPAREQGIVRARRPHRELPVVGAALRHRLRPLLARAVGRSTAATCIYVQGHVSPGIYARAFVEGRLTEAAASQLPAGERRQGHLVVSASVADARVLAVPDGVDGPRPADGDLPGAVSQVSGRPRPREDGRPQGVGVPRRRRMRRAGVARRDLARRPRSARQPDLRHQLQPAAARRPGARQRQDHPGARGGVPRRRLERDQGRLGLGLGQAVRQGQGRASC